MVQIGHWDVPIYNISLYIGYVGYAPSIKHRATATATPMKAPTGAATSAYSSSQSISAVNGFIVIPFV